MRELWLLSKRVWSWTLHWRQISKKPFWSARRRGRRQRMSRAPPNSEYFYKLINRSSEKIVLTLLSDVQRSRTTYHSGRFLLVFHCVGFFTSPPTPSLPLLRQCKSILISVLQCSLLFISPPSSFTFFCIMEAGPHSILVSFHF